MGYYLAIRGGMRRIPEYLSNSTTACDEKTQIQSLTKITRSFSVTMIIFHSFFLPSASIRECQIWSPNPNSETPRHRSSKPQAIPMGTYAKATPSVVRLGHSPSHHTKISMQANVLWQCSNQAAGLRSVLFGRSTLVQSPTACLRMSDVIGHG
jgi:hypothetical protein